MNRRQFSKHMARYLGLAFPLAQSAVPLIGSNMIKPKHKPTQLRPGDTIGLIAPGSPVSQDKMNKAIANMTSLGLKVKYNPNCMAKHGYLAGTDQQRLSDLHQYFADPEIKAIWCIRGGYGCTRLLPNINFKLIKRNPKILIGYSDITALLMATFKKTNMVCFHGPVASSDFTPYITAQLKAVLMTKSKGWEIDAKELQYEQDTIRSGVANGCLIGGNLSLITSMIGTPYEGCFKNKIVFIEDIGEKPYRIDRMLTQLRQASDLKKAAAIILGVFEDCEAKEGDDSLTLKETLKDRFYDLNVPTYYGFPVGHINDQCTLPLGLETNFDARTGKLTFMESAVQS